MYFTKKIMMPAVIAIFLFALTPLALADSFQLGISTGVGDYDYLPYESDYGGSLNFHAVLGDYGTWVDVSPFGRTWRPHVAQGWRPYMYGHWTTTSYGQTWVGYEPWGWLAYHYGNWIYTQRYGWVWVPGYDYHPGRVAWSTSYDALGWMPAPPYGYDYSRGYLSYRGPRNQFSYYDDDFAVSFGWGQDAYYGGPYYSDYRDYYYNSAYLNIVPNLWMFIGRDRYFHDNYADCYLGHNFARTAFERRLVRVSSRPLHRDTLQRIVKRNINVVPVRERVINVDKRRARIVIPQGENVRIKKHADRVVREVVAPAFAERKLKFKNSSKFRNVPGHVIVEQGRKLQREREGVRSKVATTKEKQLRTVKARERNDARKSSVQKMEKVVRPQIDIKKQERNRSTQFERPAARNTKEKAAPASIKRAPIKSAPVKRIERKSNDRSNQRLEAAKAAQQQRLEAAKAAQQRAERSRAIERSRQNRSTQFERPSAGRNTKEKAAPSSIKRESRAPIKSAPVQRMERKSNDRSNQRFEASKPRIESKRTLQRGRPQEPQKPTVRKDDRDQKRAPAKVDKSKSKTTKKKKNKRD